MKKTELQKIIKEELKNVLKESKDASAEEIVKILNSEKGEEFKANWTGATDKFDIKNAKITTINRGSGFEKAVLVSGSKGYFLYFGPYTIDGMPTKDLMFMFKCDDGIFIKNL